MTYWIIISSEYSRFGHLTKYADLILFMKDGAIVEQGSHQARIFQLFDPQVSNETAFIDLGTARGGRRIRLIVQRSSQGFRTGID